MDHPTPAVSNATHRLVRDRPITHVEPRWQDDR